MINLFMQCKTYFLTIIFLYLFSTTIYYKIRLEICQSQLNSVKISYTATQKSIKTGEAINKQISENEHAYIKEINSHRIPTDCDESVKYALSEMRQEN